MTTLIGNHILDYRLLKVDCVNTIIRRQETKETTVVSTLSYGDINTTGLIITWLPQEPSVMKNPLLLGSRCFYVYLENYPNIVTTELDVIGDTVLMPDTARAVDPGASCNDYIIIDPPQIVLNQIKTAYYRQTGLVENLYTRDMQTINGLEKRIYSLEKRLHIFEELVLSMSTVFR